MQQNRWTELRNFIMELWSQTLPTNRDFKPEDWERWFKDEDVEWENKPVHEMLAIIIDKMKELETRPVYRDDRRIK